MNNTFRQLVQGTAANTLPDYALVMALLALAVVVAITSLGNIVARLFDALATTVAGIARGS
jgi:Flp pilus assembly pilin Flp